MLDLLTTDAYRAASPDLLAEVTNGCGPSNWKSNRIPQHVLDIFKPACDRHDHAYFMGIDRTEADNELLANMTICALNHGGSLVELKVLLECAQVMYLFVREFGFKYFGRDA